jgi:hypothetical protein
MIDQDEFDKAIKLNDFNKTKLLLNHKDIDPAYDYNWGIRLASMSGHFEIVKLLLNDNRVDPSDSSNYSIFIADLHFHNDIVLLLFNDERVKNTLRKNSKKAYSKFKRELLKNTIKDF